MIMKNLFIVVFLVVLVGSIEAQKQISKNGHVWFYSHTPVEDIEAHNRQVASILDTETGDISFNMLIKSFEFKIALMQEHFNENYMESTTYPKATFKGKITDLAKVDFKKDGSYMVDVMGDLTIHGVTKNISVKGTIDVKSGAISAKSKFIVSPKDYGIKIPAMVENKIAKDIEVNVDIAYSPFKS
jgi:hypothetical protein